MAWRIRATASSATWATACPSISRRWRGSGRPCITANPSRRSPPSLPAWAKLTDEASAPSCCLFIARPFSIAAVGWQAASLHRSRRRWSPGQCITFPCSSNCCAGGRGWCSGRWRCRRPAFGCWCRHCSSVRRPATWPMVLAIGHELQLGSYLGPPLAFWLADGAFRIAGSCRRLSAGAALHRRDLLGGVHARALNRRHQPRGAGGAADGRRLRLQRAEPGFRPGHAGGAAVGASRWCIYWRALGEGRRAYWLLLAVDLGLLVLANYVGLILIVLIALFMVLTQRGVAALKHPEPWLALPLLADRGFSLLRLAGAGARPGARRLCTKARHSARCCRPVGGWWPRLLLTHLGLLLLGAIGSGWPRWRGQSAPEIDRQPIGALARRYIYFFALTPAAAASQSPFSRAASVRLTGWRRWWCCRGLRPWSLLAIACCSIASGWCPRPGSRLLVAPPLLVALGIAVLPWTFGVDLKVVQPANAEGRYFGDTFERRTGKPLQYVSGDPRDRSAGRARRAQPPARLFRLGAAAQPLGKRRRHSRGMAAFWCGRPPTTPSRRRRHWRRNSPTWCRRCRSTSRARCRACCRTSGSAGRWCARKTKPRRTRQIKTA